jgi:hypothetical protein
MSDLLRVLIWPSEPLARFRGLFLSLIALIYQQGLLFVKRKSKRVVERPVVD